LNGRPRDTWIETSRRLAPLLPTDRFDRLSAFPSPSSLSAEAKQSFADCLHQAIGELDSLHHTLTTFLPRYLLDLAPEPGRPHGEILDGTFVFADVTGFTALTGELSKRGTDSRQVLEAVAADAPSWPLLLLLTSWPGAVSAGDEMALSPLAEAEARALAALALRATQTAPDLADWLMGHTEGNPLFLLAYCRALRDGAAVTVDPATGEARWSGPPPALPISVQEIMLAEVERLAEEAREVVRRGAIAGTVVSTDVLAHLCRDVVAADELSDPVDQAARRVITAPPPPAPAFSFTSQSLHEPVYAALSHGSRDAWHEQVGDWMAGGDEATRYERLEEIAHHYSRSADAEKAARYTRLAGDKARARQADEAALAFYAQTLAAERQRAHEGIGDVRALRGECEAAHEAYRAALEETVPGDEAARGRLDAKLALLSALAGPADPGPLEEARQALPPSDRLREALGNLDTRDRLPPYADLVALFTHACLRTVPGGDP